MNNLILHINTNIKLKKHRVRSPSLSSVAKEDILGNKTEANSIKANMISLHYLKYLCGIFPPKILNM